MSSAPGRSSRPSTLTVAADRSGAEALLEML
jgi:hypothetical protein